MVCWLCSPPLHVGERDKLTLLPLPDLPGFDLGRHRHCAQAKPGRSCPSYRLNLVLTAQTSSKKRGLICLSSKMRFAVFLVTPVVSARYSGPRNPVPDFPPIIFSTMLTCPSR